MADTHEEKQQHRVRKFATGLAGGVVLIVGIIAIPYPGPGWLIVFAGLAILGREFKWAGRLLVFGRQKYDTWNAWMVKQNWMVQSATFIFTCIVVVVTIWLFNGYGLINGWFNLEQDWLKSPFIR